LLSRDGLLEPGVVSGRACLGGYLEEGAEGVSASGVTIEFEIRNAENEAYRTDTYPAFR
jgi:hypothetical protein